MMSKAVASPFRSNNALVATVVPIRMKPMREESTGLFAGYLFLVTVSKIRRIPSRGASG